MFGTQTELQCEGKASGYPESPSCADLVFFAPSFLLGFNQERALLNLGMRFPERRGKSFFYNL